MWQQILWYDLEESCLYKIWCMYEIAACSDWSKLMLLRVYNSLWSCRINDVLFPLLSLLRIGAGAGTSWAATEAGGLPVSVGEPGGGTGEGCEGAERPGGAAHPGAQRGREGQEPSPAGAQRAISAAQGGAQHCECHTLSWCKETFTVRQITNTCSRFKQTRLVGLSPNPHTETQCSDRSAIRYPPRSNLVHSKDRLSGFYQLGAGTSEQNESAGASFNKNKETGKQLWHMSCWL